MKASYWLNQANDMGPLSFCTFPVKANPLFRSHILACRVHTETAEQQPSILEYDVTLATVATFPVFVPVYLNRQLIQV